MSDDLVLEAMKQAGLDGSVVFIAGDGIPAVRVRTGDEIAAVAADVARGLLAEQEARHSADHDRWLTSSPP